MMDVSPKGVLEIAEHEGIVLGRYKCSANVDTYGIGHTKEAGGLNPTTLPWVDTRSWDDSRVDEELLKIIELFDKDLDKYALRVNRAIRVPLKQHQFDALVSFDLNTGGIYRALLTKKLNEKDPKASEHFFGWVKPPELRKRRTAEKLLFDNGNYDANGDRIPVYDALGNGKVKLRKVITGKELAALMKKTGAKHKVVKPSPDAAPVIGVIAVVASLVAAFWNSLPDWFTSLFGG